MRSQRHRAGLLVDSISGIVSVSEDDISPAPQLAGEQASMVDAVLNLEATQRMVLLLNPDELLTRTERGLLDDFTTRQKTRG
jgi:purine-binding chemotaxis protein CheW